MKSWVVQVRKNNPFGAVLVNNQILPLLDYSGMWVKEGTGISGQLIRTVIYYVLNQWHLEIAKLPVLSRRLFQSVIVTVFTIGTHDILLYYNTYCL